MSKKVVAEGVVPISDRGQVAKDFERIFSDLLSTCASYDVRIYNYAIDMTTNVRKWVISGSLFGATIGDDAFRGVSFIHEMVFIDCNVGKTKIVLDENSFTDIEFDECKFIGTEFATLDKSNTRTMLTFEGCTLDGCKTSNTSSIDSDKNSIEASIAVGDKCVVKNSVLGTLNNTDDKCIYSAKSTTGSTLSHIYPYAFRSIKNSTLIHCVIGVEVTTFNGKPIIGSFIQDDFYIPTYKNDADRIKKDDMYGEIVDCELMNCDMASGVYSNCSLSDCIMPMHILPDGEMYSLSKDRARSKKVDYGGSRLGIIVKTPFTKAENIAIRMFNPLAKERKTSKFVHFDYMVSTKFELLENVCKHSMIPFGDKLRQVSHDYQYTTESNPQNRFRQHVIDILSESISEITSVMEAVSPVYNDRVDSQFSKEDIAKNLGCLSVMSRFKKLCGGHK